jgi:hypothetical protein
VVQAEVVIDCPRKSISMARGAYALVSLRRIAGEKAGGLNEGAKISNPELQEYR